MCVAACHAAQLLSDGATRWQAGDGAHPQRHAQLVHHTLRLMSDQVRRRRREQDFHSATHALDWHRAEQLALAALQEGELSDAERDAWRERRDVARRGIARHS